MSTGATIVIDLGKTLSKVSLWDSGGKMLDRQVRPNIPLEMHGLRRLDAPAIGAWILGVLSSFSSYPVEWIVPVGHGAAVVALLNNQMAFPPLDYEQAIPAWIMAEYQGQRDNFALTGSPALPNGLNFGSQLWLMERLSPERMSKSTLLPWAQYWSWFLTGTAVSEITSLGCHSDLWCPESEEFSPMAKRLRWAERFAPIVRAGHVVGTLRPEIAEQTGLSQTVKVLAGLHDSNAALLAARGFTEIADNEATVLSTGTWFIGMRLPGEPFSISALPEDRDCLANVDVHGRLIPSARFMGGREIEALIEIDTRRVDIKPDQPALLAAVPEVLKRSRMILPTLMRGFGPYPEGTFAWLNRPEDWHERRAAACLYAALVTSTALELIGTKDRVLVEGRFAEAEVFVRALASLRQDCSIYTANAHNDVSFGALRLIHPELVPNAGLNRVKPLEQDLTAYVATWKAAVDYSREVLTS